jgi:hypothetical protein
MDRDLEALYQAMLEDLNATFPDRQLLNLTEVCKFLNCGPEVVYNWNKRADPKRRPPALTVGKQLRFQKRLLAKWLAEEQR